MARTPINYGTTAGDGTGDVLFTSFQKINNNLIDIYNKTGWAQYNDTVYTLASPFVINSGVTSILPNNAGSNITTYLPSNVTAFYNQATTKITPQNVGDYYGINIRFKAKNTNVSGVFDIGLDIGGSLGVIFKETFLFAKGAGVEQDFNILISGYSLNTFVANGGIPKITSITGNTSIYDISYQISRTHKGN